MFFLDFYLAGKAKMFYICIAFEKRKLEFVPLCNGSTEDFGSFSPGSNPGGTTKKTLAILLRFFLCLLFGNAGMMLIRKTPKKPTLFSSTPPTITSVNAPDIRFII